MKKIHLFPIILFFQYAFCQNSAVDSSNIGRDNAINSYNKMINVQSGIYNGVEYIGFLSSFEGNPYFISKEWLQGSVFYDGILYTNIPLKFDMVNEKLIIKRFDGYAIELLNEKLTYFIIDNHLFKHLYKKTAFLNGFYEVLSEGNLNIYAKKTKQIQERLNENNYNQNFEEKDRYYAIMGEQVVSVRNLKSIFALLKDNQKKAQKYVRQNHLSFKKYPEQAMIKVAEFYNQANKN